jgi:hypothetical protein
LLSVFWPIGHALNGEYGWRTLLVFAAVNLAICLPLHFLGLARRESADEAISAAALTPRRRPIRRSKAPPARSAWPSSP